MEQKSANKYFPTVGDGSGLAPSDGLYKEELQLALRNSGMPLEALRYPITPTGLHYLLIHYDIPEVNADQWRLKIAGLVATPLDLTLEEIKKRPRRTIPVTMECAGNGRALFAPRRISQPWLLEAIGNAEWTGTPLRSILQEAGVSGDAVEIVFTGLDQGVEGDQIQYYQRSLTVDEAMQGRGLAGLRNERRTAAAATRLSAALVEAGLVRHGEREMARPHRGCCRALSRLSNGARLSLRAVGGRAGRSGRRDKSARPDDSSRHSRLHDPRTAGQRRPGRLSRVKRGPGMAAYRASRSASTAARLGPRPNWANRRHPMPGDHGRSYGMPHRAHTRSMSARAMPTAICSRSISNGTSAAMATTACSA